jgi:hypothetical protein
VLLAGGVAGLAVVANARRQAAAPAGGSGWDPSSLPTAGGGGGIAADVQALLDRHNRALKAQDRAAFVANFAAGSRAAAGAGTLFANLNKFPFDSAQYQLIGQAARVFSAGGNGSTTQVDVAFVHQVSGVDVRPVTEWYRWTLVRSNPNAPLTINEVTGSPSINGSNRWVYYPAPWDLGPLTVIKRHNVILTAVAGKDATVMASVADVAEQAVNDNLTGWQGPAGTSPGLLVVGTSNRDMFYELYSGRANQHGNEAGLTVQLLAASSVDAPGSAPVYGGARITLDLTTSYFTDNHGADKPITLLRHEGAHALVAPLLSASPEPPMWVVEGFAEYMASRFAPATAEVFIADLRKYVAGRSDAFVGKWDGKSLPTDDQVYSPVGTVGNANYALSTLAYRFIAAHGGQHAVCAFVAANYQATGRDDVGAAVRKVLGMDLGTFQTRWATFVHSTIGN